MQAQDALCEAAARPVSRRPRQGAPGERAVRWGLAGGFLWGRSLAGGAGNGVCLLAGALTASGCGEAGWATVGCQRVRPRGSRAAKGRGARTDRGIRRAEFRQRPGGLGSSRPRRQAGGLVLGRTAWVTPRRLPGLRAGRVICRASILPLSPFRPFSARRVGEAELGRVAKGGLWIGATAGFNWHGKSWVWGWRVLGPGGFRRRRECIGWQRGNKGGGATNGVETCCPSWYWGTLRSRPRPNWETLPW
jgi:hypothetical protein